VIKEEMMRKRIVVLGILGLLSLSSSAAPTDPMKVFIEHLDACFLPPFQQVMDRFGEGRIRVKKRGHTYGWDYNRPSEHSPYPVALLDFNGKELELAAEAANLGVELRIGMLHLRPRPDSYQKSGFALFSGPVAQVLFESPERLSPDTNINRYLLEQIQRDEENRLNDAILFKLNEARSGKNVTFSEKGWKFVLRPIRAESATCLSCHTDAKKGETLGALIYMIRQSAVATPAKAPPP
jgi:hypothetical protein